MTTINKPNLTITIVNGEFDEDVEESADRMDPYAVLTLGTQKYDTQVATNQGRSPTWNESFNFNYDGSKTAKMTLDVWDKNRGKEPDFIGTA